MRTGRASPPLVLAIALAGATAALGALAFAGSRSRAGAGLPPPRLVPDLNVAPERHLLLLPGIGPARARAIVAERERGGPFRSAADLRRVRGIGPGTAESVAALVRVGHGRPREADP